MTKGSLQPPPKPWPPLVTRANRPVWVTIRDVLLTLLAWSLLAWMLRDPIFVAYDYLRPPTFKLAAARPLDMSLLWLRLEIFLAIAGALIGVLFVSGVIDRHRLRAAKHYPQPAALTISEQARHFKVEDQNLEEAHNRRIINVHFQEDGSISSLESADVTSSSAAINRADEPSGAPYCR